MSSEQVNTEDEGHTVLLTGFDRLPGDDRTPAERLREVLSLDDETAERLVGNTPAILKRRATAKEARDYKAALEAIGAKIVVKDPGGGSLEDMLDEITSSRTNDPFADLPDLPGANFRDGGGEWAQEDGGSLTDIDLDDHRRDMGIEPIAAQSEPPEGLDDAPAPPKSPPGPGEIDCPRCGRRQPKGNACYRCGIMFAKYDPSRPERRASSVAAPAAGRQPSAVARAPSRTASRAGPPIPVSTPAPTDEEATAPPGAPPSGGFWGGAAPAFAAPFIGIGVLWLPALIGLLIGLQFARTSAASIAGVLIVLALLTNYFARSIAAGIEGEMQAPELPAVSRLRDDYLLPGLAVFTLSVLIFAIPAYVLYRAQLTGTDDAAVDKTPIGELRVDVWNPEEVFKTEDGRSVAPKLYDSAARLVRDNGDVVEVDPGRGTVTVLGKTRTASGWLGALIFFAAMLLPLLYWPMALTVAVVARNPFRLLNPVLVVGSAVRCGVPYLFVGFIGVLLLVVAYQLAALIFLRSGIVAGSAFGALTGVALIVLAFGTYAAGVQGHLMGRLLALQGDLRAKLEQ